MHAKQTEIPGTEVPRNADIDTAIDGWLEAKDDQKYATEKTKLRHAALLLHMSNAGIDAYPYVCAKTGKKKQVVIARDPKAKSLKAPRPNRRDDDADIGEEIEVRDDPDAVDNVVEMRRVKRETIADEVDPFASTRTAMQDSDAPTELYIGGDNGTSPKKKGKRGK